MRHHKRRILEAHFEIIRRPRRRTARGRTNFPVVWKNIRRKSNRPRNGRCTIHRLEMPGLYAAIVNARMERKPLNLEKAHARAIQLLTSRATAHASFWELWIRKGRYTSQERIIPEKYRHNLLYEQEVTGEWYISPPMLREADRLSKQQAT